jgi:hypothetical protein
MHFKTKQETLQFISKKTKYSVSTLKKFFYGSDEIKPKAQENLELFFMDFMKNYEVLILAKRKEDREKRNNKELQRRYRAENKEQSILEREYREDRQEFMSRCRMPSPLPDELGYLNEAAIYKEDTDFQRDRHYQHVLLERINNPRKVQKMDPVEKACAELVARSLNAYLADELNNKLDYCKPHPIPARTVVYTFAQWCKEWTSNGSMKREEDPIRFDIIKRLGDLNNWK